MLGKKKKMLQVSISKEHYEALESLAKQGTKSKSQIVEDSLAIIFGLVSGAIDIQEIKENKEN